MSPVLRAMAFASVLVACVGCGAPTDAAQSPVTASGGSGGPSPRAESPAAGPASGNDGRSPREPPPSAPPAAASGDPTSSAAAGAPPGAEEALAFSTGGKGTLPAATVRKVLRQKLGAYASCYESARARTPGLKGRLSLRLRIEPTGSVSAVEVRSPQVDAAFSTCLEEVVRALRFPRPKGGEVEVVYPLDFADG